MPFIHGSKVNGRIQVKDDVFFLGSVAGKYVSPWGEARLVDGVDGLDANDGQTPTSSKKTIAAAVAASSRGGVIYIRPKTYTLGTGFARYEEDVIIPLAANDLSIIGVTRTLNADMGGVRWKPTGNTTPLTVYAPGVHLENIGFFSEVAYSLIKLENDGNVSKVGSVGFTMYNCAIKGNVVHIDSGDGVRFVNCYFHAMYDGSLTGGIVGVTTGGTALRRLSIKDCMFFGGNGVAPATAYITLTGGTITETEIYACRFGIIPASAKYIVNTNVTGGILANCHFAKADVHVTSDLTLSGMVLSGCTDSSQYFIV